MAERALLTFLIVVSAGCAQTPAAWASPADVDDRLLTAASRGDLDSIQKALKEGANVEAHEADGATALMVAALSGHPDVVSALLGRGAGGSRCRRQGSHRIWAHAVDDCLRQRRIVRSGAISDPTRSGGQRDVEERLHTVAGGHRGWGRGFG